MEIQKGRLGQFFFFLGAIILVVFFSVGQTQAPMVAAFFIGVFLTVTGLILMAKNRKPPAPSGRFRLVKKMQESSKKQRPGDKRDN